MSDYKPVSDALDQGADPAILCTTCPWDRTCLSPPSMTRAQIESMMAEAKTKDDAEITAARLAGKQDKMPVSSLLTILTVAGRDTQAQICPVFALRLRSSGGRQIADALKDSMQRWDDQS